ncbi:MAG: carbohydrate-binding protein [Hungatella sp.]|nr:carbohydrate-binding protein [Hungatella sp.]
MADLKITIMNKEGENRFQATGRDQVLTVYEGEYEPGDSIVFETTDTDTYYVIRVDDCMDEAYVYLTAEKVVYTIPFHEKRVSYNPRCFTGKRHYITMRRAKEFENSSYRNLAKNVMDQHGDLGCYPHAFANVETRGESVFAARNAIDGILANKSHGPWPYESWGINTQDDAEITLDFGRPVDFDQVVLYTRADFPHDNWWVKATLIFSDGTEEIVEMEKSAEPHMFHVEKKNITWIKLCNLIKADDPSPFPALSQIEVYGVNSYTE